MKLNVKSSFDTIKYILKHKCSVARYGDGELCLMLGLSIPFQKHNKKMAKLLKRTQTTDKCLICIPNIFDKNHFNKKVFKKKTYKFWKKNKIFTAFFYKKYFKNQVLGDAFISRFYMPYLDHSHAKEYVDLIKQIWQDRNLVIVEGEQTRMGIGNDFFENAKSIKRILCPAKNAFNKYDEILNGVKSVAKKGDLILIALGPTATILAYDLSTNFQALDLGHIDIEYEWFLRSAENKMAIDNKYVNECGNTGRHPKDCEDEKYLSQICLKII